MTPEEERCLLDMDLLGRTVFDVGGFHGEHTLFLANRVGDSGRIVTFEPHPENRELILEQLTRAGLSNAEVRATAVGAENGELEFGYPDDLGLGSADPQIKAKILGELEGRALTFPVCALDSEIDAGRLPEPDLVKVDVEGLEYDVLAGMSALARRSRPALFLELHGVDYAQEIANYRRVITWLLDHAYGVTHVESGRTLRSREDVSGCYAGQHLHCV
jgi:FkbM family methyltransferase